MKLSKYTLLVLVCLFASCLKEDDLKKPFVSYVPQRLDDGWIVSSPSEEQMDEAQLCEVYNDLHNRDDLWQVRSLLVFRNGRLVAESYTKDSTDISNPRAIWSCTKQIMGILTGIALDQGVIGSLDDSIGTYLPSETAMHPDKSNITIAELMQMKSGIAYNNGGDHSHTDQILRQFPDNSIDFILSIPNEDLPGQSFHYHDGNPHILSAILQKQTGVPVRDWAAEVLFSKLNIKNYDWQNYRDGVTLGAFGIRTTPRELSKIGQCVLDSGLWNGQRIVSAAWIYQMLQVTQQETDLGKSFCYFWWRDLDREIIFSRGHGGQFVFIKPSKGLIVTITAEPNTQGSFQLSLQDALDVFDRVDRCAL